MNSSNAATDTSFHTKKRTSGTVPDVLFFYFQTADKNDVTGSDPITSKIKTR